MVSIRPREQILLLWCCVPWKVRYTFQSSPTIASGPGEAVSSRQLGTLYTPIWQAFQGLHELSHVWLVTAWTVACQAPLFMGFTRQECWNGLPYPSPGRLPHPGIEPRSPALQTDFFFFFVPAGLWGKLSKWIQMFQEYKLIQMITEWFLLFLVHWYCGCFHFKHTTFLAV